jgi:hypothetical protein
MKKELAIKGHRTRGKEIIEILQMLGGGKTVYGGTDILCIYHLDKSRNIMGEFYEDKSLTHLSFEVLTLEEFLEKFPFKINDRVINSGYSGTGIITEMVWDCNNRGVKYCVKFEDFDVIVWLNYYDIKFANTCHRTDYTLYTDPLHELCVGKLPTLMIDSEVCDDEVEIILNDYEIVIKDGKTYAVKKKSKYPTTYEECCGILGITFDYPDIRMVTTDEFSLYSNFIQLIRCRDAYWKIAGEEMGLSTPWVNTSKNQYLITSNPDNEIITEFFTSPICKYVISFPTKEMRDVFYENFKDLIEKCKKLL